MKRLYMMFSLFLITFSVHSQNNFFVLVDVSGSGNDAIKLDAKNQVYELLNGNYVSNGWDAQKISDNTISNLVNSLSKKPLVEQNSWFCLMPFGNKDTYKKYKIIQNKNSPSDFQMLFSSSYPTVFKDGLTFSQIAEAFTVSLAKTFSINDYYLIIITDDLDDKGNTKSINTYDSFEKDLLMGYGNESSSIVKNIGTLVKNDYYIKLRKVTNVNNSKIQPAPGVIRPALVDSNSSNAVVTIISPPEAKKGKEYEQKTETLNVNWTCSNCPDGIKYIVTVSQYDGGKFRESKKDLVSNTATFKVPDGKFRISVSASNFSVSPRSTFVSISTGSYGWVFFILLLLIAVIVIIVIRNKIREKNLKKPISKNSSNVFSNNDGKNKSSSSNLEF